MKHGLTIAAIAAGAYYLWSRREAADPGKQETVALPSISPVATAPPRTTTMGPDELAALVAGKGYLGTDGYMRYTETAGDGDKSTSGGIAW